MSGYAIVMLVFGILLILAGLYIYKGHNNRVLLWKGYNPKASKKELQTIGRTTMFVGVAPIISALSSLIVEENSFIPIVVLFVFVILAFIISLKMK